MGEKVLEVEHLRTEFKQEKKKYVTAINDVSFTLNEGEIVGLVGESGCGKSVTSLSIMRLLGDTSGRVTQGKILFKGQYVLSLSNKQMRNLRGGRMSMIFQDPMSSLNPVTRIETQMMETLLLHRTKDKAQARRMAAEMLKKVGIPDVETTLRSYPHQLSGGMCQRVMIAMSMSCDPQLLIADEPTTALDVTIQAQILELMKKLQREEKTTILLITHDLGVVAQMCSRVLVMYAGRIVEEAPVHELFYNHRHPYTQGLIYCIPKIGSVVRRLPSIRGSVPDLALMPAGCKFAPRCPFASDECRKNEPELLPYEGDPTHLVRCFRTKEVLS